MMMMMVMMMMVMVVMLIMMVMVIMLIMMMVKMMLITVMTDDAGEDDDDNDDSDDTDGSDDDNNGHDNSEVGDNGDSDDICGGDDKDDGNSDDAGDDSEDDGDDNGEGNGDSDYDDDIDGGGDDDDDGHGDDADNDDDSENFLNWLFNDAVSTTRLFRVDDIDDGEMRPRIRHRLPRIHITVGGTSEKTQPVEKLLSSGLLSKKLKDRILKTDILSVVLYGSETCTLTQLRTDVKEYRRSDSRRKTRPSKVYNIIVDGMALLAEELVLRDILLELNVNCEQYRRKINANKTKTMVFGRKIKEVWHCMEHKYGHEEVKRKRLETFEMWIRRRMERVKWTDRIRNEAVLERVGEGRIMLKLIRKRKRNWLCYWLRRNRLLKDAVERLPIRDSNTLPAREQVARESTRAPQSTGDGARLGEARGGCARNCYVRSEGGRTLPNLPDVRPNGDIQIIREDTHRNFSNYGLVIKEEMQVKFSQSVSQSCVAVKPASRPERDFSCVRNCGARSPEFECSGPQLGDLSSKFSGSSLKVCGSRFCERNCHNPGDLRNYAVKLTGFLEFGKDATTLPPRGFDGSLSILLNEGCDWLLTGEDKISVTVRKTFIYDNQLEVGSRRKIFGAKRDEVTGEWRKLHNTELHALYSSPDIIRNIKSRRLRWAGHVARMGVSRNEYRVLVERPKGKGPLGRPRRRWEDNIEMDLREMGYDVRDWINLAQDRDQWRAFVRAAMNLRVP
ncbi:hypothetical protein ANN_16221 [Periplaneta americana]|uniref:Uncharacterized protein n=1 Tax=Periplaneta americana TaxID=6978 RepID=A0ABQ8SIN9_PERAM|nr:hypothetical protein ANN_16221 [Periplaneta americana]